MWYFVKDGQAFGPVDIESLNEKFRVGSLGPADLVWRLGMDAWAKASTVPCLWAESCAPPPMRVELDAPPSTTALIGPLLKASVSVGMILLLYPLYHLIGGYVANTGLRHENLQTNGFVQKPADRLNGDSRPVVDTVAEVRDHHL